MIEATHIREEHLNETEGYWLGESVTVPLTETLFDPEHDTPGDVFRYCLREFGRCISSVYVDTEDGAKRVGWVFQARERYEDTGEPFLHETWVTLLVKTADARPAQFVGASL